MKKVLSLSDAAGIVKDGMTVMIGGFMSCGTPHTLMDALAQRGLKNLTVISNDAGFADNGIGKLVAAGAVKKLVTSHIGLNPHAGQLMNRGELEVMLVPQGSLAEMIRAGGAGLGGVLTQTGLGTEVAEGKEIVTVDGKEYLLEKPLHADVSLIFGSVVDVYGNIFYEGTTRNFNPLMATAADIVIAETEKLVAAGEIQAEAVVTPGVFVDYIVEGEQ